MYHEEERFETPRAVSTYLLFHYGLNNKPSFSKQSYSPHISFIKHQNYTGVSSLLLKGIR